MACIVQVLGRILRQGIRQAVEQVRGGHEEHVWREHIAQAEPEEMLRQYGGQANGLSEHWCGEANFPSLDDPVSSKSLAQCSSATTWAMVAGWHAAGSCAPKMPKNKAKSARVVKSERPCSADNAAVIAVGPVEKRAARAPALVGGLSVHYKKQKAFTDKQARANKAEPRSAAAKQGAKMPGEAPSCAVN